MGKRSISLNILLGMFFFLAGQQYSAQYQLNVQGIWNGTVTMKQVYTGEFGKSILEIRTTFTENNGSGSMTYEAEWKGGFGPEKVSCSGTGQAELHELSISADDAIYNGYYIAIVGPGYTCVGGVESGQGKRDITISDKVLISNSNILSGTQTQTYDYGIGPVTTTLTWHLQRSTNNAELIVTPEDYDNWLPKPGRDELTKGTVMKINLKVKSINGKPLTVKARSFELTLSNTSIEPGITINYPVSPRANQLPDLRFLRAGIGESLSDDQFLSIPCNDGSTGKVSIASYDGGGRTILSAVAILEDGSQIKGQLFISGGEVDIRIPKREIGSIIATSWLNANGNPGETDDKEESNGNTNNGDGLTAYEEYRGVISIDTFRRLSPQKKELGILLKRSDYGFLKEGILRFENASDIKVYVFGQNEIPDNRRLNRNALSAHDYNQFVLRISKGNNRGETDIYGTQTTGWGVAYPRVDIPARVTHISIDVDQINTWYQQTVQIYGAANLPFTAKDLIASTTAHEIGHGVNLHHHARQITPLPSIRLENNPPRVFYADSRGNWESPDRPITINGPIGLPGNPESGNVKCFMCYRNKSVWVRVTQNNNEVAYHYVPWISAGSLFCVDKKGTGINENNQYFGNAIKGECLGHIKLRD